MSSPKTPKTPQRRRLSVKEKVKIIEDSKKTGFDKAKIMKEYGISRPTVISVLKNQFETLKAVDSGIINDKSKSLKKSPLAELESQLYEWLCKRILEVFDTLCVCIFMYCLFSDTPRFSDIFLTDQKCH